MIAPTHDWFTGVSGLLLLDSNGRWLRTHEVNLYPWDAGTEDGDDFSLNPSVPTDPQGVIESLRGIGPFTIERIASIEFTLGAVKTTRSLDENTAPNRPVGPAVNSPVAFTGTGAITYALSGADAASFNLNANTGQLTTKTGCQLRLRDDGELRGHRHRQPGRRATAVTVAIDVVNVEETGTLTVAPTTANVDVELTATLTDGDTVTNPIWTWQRSDTGTSGWADISGANSATYTAVDADEGKHLRVRVVYTDNISAGKTIITKLTGAVGPSTTRSGDNSLSALALSGLTLSPAFQSSSNRNEYTAAPSYPTTVTTITATATDTTNATVELLDGDDNAIVDADSVATGTQMAIAIGENTLKVRVTAHNTSVRTYTITVTRAKPTVSIEPPSGSPTESDDNVTFTVRRSPAAVDALVLSVSVSESGGDMIEDGTREVTIPAGATAVASVELAVPVTGDDAWENHSTVTATIAADDHYTVSTGSGEAVVTVNDDDFPMAEAVLEVPDSVGEDDSIVATVTVTTERDEQPHRDATSVYLHTRAGTAGTGDFVALTNDTGEVTLAVGDFDRVDLDDNPGDQVHVWRYRRVHDVTIETSADDVRENEETFTVVMARLRAR